MCFEFMQELFVLVDVGEEYAGWVVVCCHSEKRSTPAGKVQLVVYHYCWSIEEGEVYTFGIQSMEGEMS